MTPVRRDISIGTEQQVLQGAIGAQGLVVIAAVPSGGDVSLIGQVLDGQTLSVDGTYRCLIPMAGLASLLEVHLNATFAAGTVTTDLNTLYLVQDLNDPSTWTEKTAATGDGAMTTTVLQSSQIATLSGERYAQLEVIVAGGAAPLFTRAEYNGI